MLTVAELVSACAGRLVAGRGETRLSGVTTDSRAVQPGELFVALAGPNFDGHDFAAAAVAKGAAAVLASRVPELSGAIPVVQVEDTRLALGRLARWWRGRFAGPLVALTGSNGKTTVKEMIAAILRAACRDPDAVLATEGNLNNDIGMPLTLLRLRPRHRFAVIEMGMNHLGEIEYLTHIARPDVALVNNAQRAHLGEVGSLAEVAQAKGEIFAGLAADGVAVVNADDPHADYWLGLNRGRRRLTFGLASGDVRAAWTAGAAGSDCHITTPAGEIDVQLRVPGEHNVRNALAAAAACIALGVGLDAVAAGLASFSGAKGRLERKPGANGAWLIDDTYNANPDSMAAALAVLGGLPGTRIFVMGDMGELGDEAAALHAEVGRAARLAGVNRLLALGEHAAQAAQAFGEGGRHFADLDALVQALRPSLAAGVTVLVKGSRFMRMERVVAALAQEG